MAGHNLSQNPSRNVSHNTTFGVWSAIEKMILNVFRRFRFPEMGKVVQVYPEDMEVIVELPYRKVEGLTGTSENGARMTKRLKVYSIFASLNEGICAPPNVGDWGICFFRVGDTNSGFFFGFHWGDKNTVPTYHDHPINAKDLLIKRNDSHILIDKDSDIELWHKYKNQVYISEGFETFNTIENQSVQIQRFSNQHTKPWEFKLISFVKTVDGKQENFQPPGKTEHIQLQRRRITIWDKSGRIMCCGGRTIGAGECPFDARFINESSTPIPDDVFYNYVADRPYTAVDETVDKIITQKDDSERWWSGKITKHTIQYSVGTGTSLLTPSYEANRKDYEEIFEFNWDSVDGCLWFKEVSIFENMTTMKETVWSGIKRAYRGMTADPVFGGQLQEGNEDDVEGGLYYLEALSKIRYELFEYLALTDDTVAAQALRNTKPDPDIFANNDPSHESDDRWNKVRSGENYYVPGVGWKNVYEEADSAP